MNEELPPQPLNASLTQCISDLAARAEEIGENNTAIVLFALAGHRALRADAVMAVTAQAQAKYMAEILKKTTEDKDL